MDDVLYANNALVGQLTLHQRIRLNGGFSSIDPGKALLVYQIANGGYIRIAIHHKWLHEFQQNSVLLGVLEEDGLIPSGQLQCAQNAHGGFVADLLASMTHDQQQFLICFAGIFGAHYVAALQDAFHTIGRSFGL